MDFEVPAKPHWRRDSGRGVEEGSRWVDGEVSRKIRVSTKCFKEVVRTCVLFDKLTLLSQVSNSSFSTHLA